MNSPAEVGVIRTYIETMLEMPWDKTCKEHKDIAFARQVLDEDHYGLEKVKERVLEYLAVRALTKKGEHRSFVWWVLRELERHPLRNLFPEL